MSLCETAKEVVVLFLPPLSLYSFFPFFPLSEQERTRVSDHADENLFKFRESWIPHAVLLHCVRTLPLKDLNSPRFGGRLCFVQVGREKRFADQSQRFGSCSPADTYIRWISFEVVPSYFPPSSIRRWARPTRSEVLVLSNFISSNRVYCG